MHPRRLRIFVSSPQVVERAAEILRGGGLVAFPTETVYGLGADAANDWAIAALFALKGRPAHNPLIIHVKNTDVAKTLAVWSEEAEILAHRFWPGPLTLILPLGDDADVVGAATAGLSTIAIRVPAHPVAQDLLAAFGGPIAAPSANRSGTPSPTTPHHVLSDFGDKTPLILAAGRAPIGVESTVLDLSREGNPALLRRGAITSEDIAACLNLQNLTIATTPCAAPRSPGLLLRHYAPRIPVRLRAYEVYEGEALLAFGPTQFMNVQRAKSVLNLSEKGDLEEAAANLFAHLRALDKAEYKAIAVMDIPARGIGLAIIERLERAAASA